MPAHQKNRLSPARRQCGAVLMLLLMLVAVGALAVFVSGLNRATVQLERDRITNEALAQAKEALIGRAASDENRPGSLPCPDLVTNIPGSNIPNDGIADLLAGTDCPSYIGRLPWRTLKLPDLRDGDGERLWYELSPGFRDSIASEPLNDVATIGTLDGGGVAAKIYAPRVVLAGQSRAGAAVNISSNYLEGQNDVVLRLFDTEVFFAARRRVAGEIRAVLTAPYPATMPVVPNPPNPLRFDENWAAVVTYTQLLSTQAKVTFSGCATAFLFQWNAAVGRSDLSGSGPC